MFVPLGTFPEACALVLGYDIAREREVLDPFQDWLGARRGRPELAFWIHVLAEAFPGSTVDIGDLQPSQQERAVDVLFQLLEACLTHQDPRAFRLAPTSIESDVG